MNTEITADEEGCRMTSIREKERLKDGKKPAAMICITVSSSRPEELSRLR